MKKNELVEAARNGSYADLEKALEARSDVSTPDMFGDRALTVASDARKTALLLKYGADPNERGSGGNSALHAAAFANDYERTKLLLMHGADPNARNTSGNVPLHMAAQRNSGECAELLLEFGAVADARNDRGETPERIARLQSFLGREAADAISVSLTGERSPRKAPEVSESEIVFEPAR